MIQDNQKSVWRAKIHEYPLAHTYHVMSELAKQTHRMFGSPTAQIPFRINIKAEAFGCDLNTGTKDMQPDVIDYSYSGSAEIPDDLITIDEYLSKSTITTVLKTAEDMSNDIEIFSVWCLNGPSDLLINLIGMGSSFIGMIAEHELIERWTDTLVPYVKAYVDALSDRVDSVIVIDGASTDITPPEMFDRFTKNRLKDVFRSIDGAYRIMHCCGETLELNYRLAILGEDVLSPESSRHPYDYVKAVNGRILLAGCVSPVNVMLLGGGSDVKRAVDISSKAGFNFITPECGIFSHTSDENLRALFT